MSHPRMDSGALGVGADHYRGASPAGFLGSGSGPGF